MLKSMVDIEADVRNMFEKRHAKVHLTSKKKRKTKNMPSPLSCNIVTVNTCKAELLTFTFLSQSTLFLLVVWSANATVVLVGFQG